VIYVNPRCHLVQLIKRGGIMQSNKPFTSQLRFIKLMDALPYETLQAVFTNSFSPYFKLVQSLLDLSPTRFRPISS